MPYKVFDNFYNEINIDDEDIEEQMNLDELYYNKKSVNEKEKQKNNNLEKTGEKINELNLLNNNENFNKINTPKIKKIKKETIETIENNIKVLNINEDIINRENNFTDIENEIYIKNIFDNYLLCNEDREPGCLIAPGLTSRLAECWRRQRTRLSPR